MENFAVEAEVRFVEGGSLLVEVANSAISTPLQLLARPFLPGEEVGTFSSYLWEVFPSALDAILLAQAEVRTLT